MRLLIVEDNKELARLLADALQTAQMDSDVVRTAEDARHVLRSTNYAALILDIGLPDDDGLAVLRELRERRDPLPVMILTAKSAVHDKIAGLNAGADDYLVKPFALEELVARLRVLLRRPGHLLGSTLEIANVRFDTVARQIFIEGAPQLIAPRELDVLELLMRRINHVVPKRVLEDHIFARRGDVASSTLDVSIHRLRKELADLGARVTIHTVRGVGYMIGETK